MSFKTTSRHPRCFQKICFPSKIQLLAFYHKINSFIKFHPRSSILSDWCNFSVYLLTAWKNKINCLFLVKQKSLIKTTLVIYLIVIRNEKNRKPKAEFLIYKNFSKVLKNLKRNLLKSTYFTTFRLNTYLCL